MKSQELSRREFLKAGGLTGSIALTVAGSALLSSNSLATEGSSSQDSYLKFLNPSLGVGELTESAKTMRSRDELLQSVLNSIPTPERVEQIHNILIKHIHAEEAADLDATMATLEKEPVFESMSEGKIYRGHQSVAEDYARRYYGLTRKLHITNLSVNKDGAFAEVIWEGLHKNTYKGIKPVKNAKVFNIPMVIYYEVSARGLIQRESVYYDQYLGALSLDIIPDILSSKLQLMRLNPLLLFRRG